MNKPKARYDERRGLWVVWDGVSSPNGWVQYPSLEDAYNHFVVVQLSKCFGPTIRFCKPFKVERRNETKQ